MAEQPVASHPWSLANIFTGGGEDYLRKPDDQKAIILRGRDNWLNRFVSQSNAATADEAIREEVQALFARWLRMQNLCVLMGAGASYYVTKALNANLLDSAAKLLVGRRSEKTLSRVRELASQPEAPGKRIEQFLSQLVGFVTLFDSKELPLDKAPFPAFDLEPASGETNHGVLRDLLLDLERAVAATCNVDLPDSALATWSDDSITPHENFLSKLMARDPQDGRAKLFTTNYDTLLEQAMDRLGILYCDGFTGTVGRKFNPAAYDLDHYYPGELGEGRVRRYHKFVQLYKLHGSINWRKTSEPKAGDPYGVRFDSRPVLRHEEVIAAGDDGARNRLDEIFSPGEGLAILPTTAKFGQTLTMPFAHLFRSFGHALQQTQTVLFVIGYGGMDEHVNQMIHDALVNPGFTCVIVGPSPSDWAKRLCLADYCGRVYFVGGPWGYFETFAEYLLPDLEALKTDIAVARTLRELRSTGRNEGPPDQGSQGGNQNGDASA
jgi:hypothetical protein